MAQLKITLPEPTLLLVELTRARAAVKRSRGKEAGETPHLDSLMVHLHARLFPDALAAHVVSPEPPP